MSDAAADRVELAKLEEEWMTAMQARDMDRLEELVSPGFRFTAIHLAPEPFTREQWMGAAREGYTLLLAMREWEFEAFTRLRRGARETR